MDQILRLNEFFVEGGKQDLSHVLLHITEPSTPEEAKKGYFFALCEVNNGEPAFITKLQDLIDRAENEYYDIPEDENSNSFESVLEKINQEAFVLEKVEGELNCIVGVIRQKEIIFTYFGNPHLLLFYKNKQGVYERMDLIKSNSEEEEQNDQLFSQIIQGKLSLGDYLFIGTPHISDFFSHDRLEKIITTRSALQSAQHLEKVLAELRNGYSFGGMIINLFKPETTEVKKPRPVLQGSSTSSLHKMFNREQNTASTLSPSIIPRLDRIKNILSENNVEEVVVQQEKVSVPAAEINSNHISTRPNRAPKTDLKDNLKKAGSVLIPILKIIGKGVAHFFIFIYLFINSTIRTILLLFIVIINYQNRRNSILENWKTSYRSYRENIKHLPLITKLMLLGSVILTLIFFGSLSYIKYNQKIAAEEKKFNELVSELEAKKSSIESAIIYKNDELAISEFRSFQNMIPNLDCNSKDHLQVCAKFTSQVENLGEKLRKITTVQPTLLTNWETEGAPTNLVRLKNKLIAFSPTTSTLFSYDLLTGESKKINTYNTIEGFSESAVPKENDYAIFLYNKKQLIELNAENLTTKLIDLNFANDKSQINSFVVYNRRLYSLDIINGDILRHDSTKLGFGQGQLWTKEKNSTLKNGVDMAIDGDIYVTKSNGEISKFSAGISNIFNIPNLDPAFSSENYIWTYTDIPYLYILEPSQKRLIIAEKTGHLITQIMSPEFKNPTGFSIDPSTKTAFIIDSGKLYKISLP